MNRQPSGGLLEMYAWRDSAIQPKHFEKLRMLTGVPSALDEVVRRGDRECWWPLRLDPDTLVAPIETVDQHLWLAGSFLSDRRDIVRSLQSQWFLLRLTVSQVVLDKQLYMDVATMKMFCELDIGICVNPLTCIADTYPRPA